MIIFIFFGVISLIAGILFLFCSKTLKKMNEGFNKVVNKIAVSLDERVLRLRLGTGLSCVLLSLTLFFLAYWAMKKHG